MIKSLYPEQLRKADEVHELLCKRKVVLMHFATRTGKTPVSLRVAELYGAKKVLFVTKKKAISGIKDFQHLFSFNLTIINYESLHKLSPEYDFIIADESHTLGAFPKPSLRTKRLASLIGTNPLLLLTATPALESPSQYFHQFWVSKHSPFNVYKNFYHFAQVYIDIQKIYVSGRTINQYNKLKPKTNFAKIIDAYTVRWEKSDIGSFGDIDEKIDYIPLDKHIKRLMAIFLKDKLYTFKTGDDVVCDSNMKLRQVMHQLSSGVLKIDDNKYFVLSKYKAEYIKQKYSKYKIAIFYLYKGEEKLLKETFDTTHDIDEFNVSDKVFIGQFQSSSMGTNLSKADYIIFMNISFSATMYEQVKDRGRVKGKTEDSRIVWIFSNTGIEKKVFDRVKNKIDYSLSIFLDDYGLNK